MTRRGVTLSEIIVALVLGSIVLGLVATSLTAQRKHERTTSDAAHGTAIADEAVSVLSAALARASTADTVYLRGDTAIDIDATIGTGIACWINGDSIIFRDDGSQGAFELAPDSADHLDAVTAESWWSANVIAARSRTAAAGACNGPQRVVRTRPLPVVGSEPAFVRVTRRTRFVVYRGGDNAWWLGSRTCSRDMPVTCTAAQPIAGPLASSRALQFRIDTIGGSPVISVTVSSQRATRTAVMTLRP